MIQPKNATRRGADAMAAKAREAKLRGSKPQVAVLDEPAPAHKLLFDLGAKEPKGCRWVDGDPGIGRGQAWSFCQAHPVNGHAYCEEHFRRAIREILPPLKRIRIGAAG